MADSNFVGALTEDIQLLSSDAPPPAVPESDGLPQSSSTDDGESYWNANDLTPEEILRDDLRVYRLVDGKLVDEAVPAEAVALEEVQEPAQENEPEDTKPKESGEDKPAPSLLNGARSRLAPASQDYQSPSEQETAALSGGLEEFFSQEVAEAFPPLQSMDASKKEQIIGKVNAQIFGDMHVDKRFMASLGKTYDGSRQSLQRGAVLLAEKWLRALPRAIRKLNLPEQRVFTQAEANRMNFRDILDVMRPVEVRGKWIPHESALAGA